MADLRRPPSGELPTLAGQTNILATRSLSDRKMEFRAMPPYIEGRVVVRRTNRNVKITEGDVISVVRKARVPITDEVQKLAREGVAAINASDMLQASFVVVEGVASQPGSDSELVWTHEPKKGKRGQLVFGNVDEGDLLLTITGVRRGKPGRTIFDDTIRAEVSSTHTANIRDGRHVRSADNGTKFYARKSGRLTFNHNVLSVEDLYEVPGNVDKAHGDIDFNGPVIIHGDVRAGMHVWSGAWIEIHGSIERGFVEAAEDIRVHGGINGRGRGRVKCGGSLTARYMNGATVDVGGDVEIARSVMHSNIYCTGNVKVITQAVRASNIAAGGNIDVPVLGSQRGTPVEVAAGMAMSRERDIMEVNDSLGRLSEERQRLRHLLGGLLSEPERIVEVSPLEKRAEMFRGLKRYCEIIEELNGLDRCMEDLVRVGRRGFRAKVRITRRVWREVTIRVGNASFKVGRSRSGPLEFGSLGSSVIAE